MDSSKRPLVLGGILAAVLAAGMGRPIFMQPLTDAKNDLRDAKSDLKDAEEKDFQLQSARARIDNAIAGSLPPSVNDAQRLYLEWMTNLAQECNFAQRRVTPGRKEPRTGKFHLVSVQVEGECSLQDLSRFLFQFKQVDLMHRITQLDITSSGTAGNPRMEVILTAQAMSVVGAEDRLELSARSPLTKDVDKTTTQIAVNDSSGFPKKAPFLVKLDFETLHVTEVGEQTWTVERAWGGSSAAEHSANTIVRHFPVMPARSDRRFEDYQAFLNESLFTKPAVPTEYNPKLAGVDDVTIAPGETASLSVRVEDYNADIGEVVFALSDAADGIRLDPETGQVSWETSDDQEPNDYKLTIQATQQNNPELQLSQEVTITVKLPNEAPALELPESLTVYLGREFTYKATATDDQPVENLSFALEGEKLPEGLVLDSTSGILSWAPPVTFAPGSYTIQIKVTDEGDPAESATGSIELLVQDDDAKYTEFSGLVTRDGQPEAWFTNQRTKTDSTLSVGDELKVADIEAEIIEIEARMVRMKDDQGIWLLALGNCARQRVLEDSLSETTAPMPENVVEDNNK
jgi:hypothetical protein